MGENASIDEFVAACDGTHGDDGPGDGGDDTTQGDGTGDATDGEPDDETDSDETTPSDLEDVAPTVTIYGWVPQKTACEACGESTERRWRDDGVMVCRECKEW